MIELPLPLVRGDDLPDEVRRVLRPGQTMQSRDGRSFVLPSTFLRIDSWEQAREVNLTAHFGVWELIGVDVREVPVLSAYPRYLPCALLLLAGALELLRLEVDTFVHVAANGGYRSPSHALSVHASRHCWGTAANIYRIGDVWLDSQHEIEKYAAIARRVIPGVWVRPYGSQVAQADDHLHLDLGYTIFDPMNA
ncbi:MAG TPA: hypothetical protein VEL28_04840 [Candidatus Binatia bacterium]|nr:hypothetical protein [Candidatus Binatia bacterium]